MSSALRASGSTHAWRVLRRSVLDNRPHICATCGRELRPAEIDVGHITPRIEGGSDDQLQIQCHACNRSAGGKLGNRRKRARQVQLMADPGVLFPGG